MQADILDNEILLAIHDLPMEKKQTILDFSLFIKSLMPNSNLENKPAKRQAGLGHGSVISMSDDFDAPLPDNFWLGDDA